VPQQVAQQQKRVRQLHVQQEPSKTEDPTASAGPLVVGGRASPVALPGRIWTFNSRSQAEVGESHHGIE
jgi:hypothetical protein